MNETLFPFFSLTEENLCQVWTKWCISRTDVSSQRTMLCGTRKKKFPDQKPEKRSRPEEVTSEDVLWNSVAHNRAKNRSQASNVMKATGSRGVNCFMLLPNHDRPNQAFPDMMHDVKNLVCAFFELFIEKGDSVKVRNAERDLGQFKRSWFVKDKQDDIPEEEQLTNGNFFQIILLLKRFYNNLYRGHMISNAIWDL